MRIACITICSMPAISSMVISIASDSQDLSLQVLRSSFWTVAAHTPPSACHPSLQFVTCLLCAVVCVWGGEGYLESKQCSQRLHKPCLILSTCHKRYRWAHCEDVKMRTCGCTALTEPHLPCCLLDLCSSCSAARHCCGAPPPWGPKQCWQSPAVLGRLAGHGSDGCFLLRLEQRATVAACAWHQ
ncbi:hypothetical protein COO60DRAFT_676828 [Scenedesmus sp. NREL 46B-D3]|nr:hypothetical protein COO60DRAFT_676828 [Scenedesmus sp. NREL 46B-D3]